MLKGKIVVLGLGPGGVGLIPAQNLELLKKVEYILVRTAKHPAVEELQGQGIKFGSFDYLYEQLPTFEEVYQTIVDKLIAAAAKYPQVIYAVPGHPLVAESTVPLLLQAASREGVETEVLPAMSCLDAIYAVLRLDPTAGMLVKDALLLKSEELVPAVGLILTQLYNRQIASDVKLTLMEVYPDDHLVKLVRGAGVSRLERMETIPLFQLDRIDWIDHLTSLYVPPAQQRQGTAGFPLDPLVNVMQELLGENGCPWDREQTHDSLKRYLIEECYEVIEAIEERDMYKLCDELGDLLLQIVFHAELASRSGYFNINDVIAGITEKMIRRHPHVFGEIQVDNSTQVLANWDEIKKQEKENSGLKTVMDIPRGLPALYRAEKVQNRAAKVGFDWPDIEGPWAKFHEEIKELKEALAKKDFKHTEEEMGDILFAAVNISRFLHIDPEEALQKTVAKFVKRFRFIEQQARLKGKELREMSLEEMDKLWEEAKNR